MADFIAREEGTLSVRKGELVEVIDTSRNSWTLIRTVNREPREGWIPSEFIKRYNYMDPYSEPTGRGERERGREGGRERVGREGGREGEGGW